MRGTRFWNPVGYRFGIATLAFAMFMPSLLHAKGEKTSTETLVRVRQTGIQSWVITSTRGHSPIKMNRGSQPVTQLCYVRRLRRM